MSSSSSSCPLSMSRRWWSLIRMWWLTRRIHQLVLVLSFDQPKLPTDYWQGIGYDEMLQQMKLPLCASIFLPWPSRGRKISTFCSCWLWSLCPGWAGWQLGRAGGGLVQAAGEQSCYLGQGPQSTPGRHGAPLLRHRPAPDILHSRGRTQLQHCYFVSYSTLYISK